MATFANSINLIATQYNVLSGDANNQVANIAPNTSGYVLTSNGASAQPTFQASADANDFTRVFMMGGM